MIRCGSSRMRCDVSRIRSPAVVRLCLQGMLAAKKLKEKEN